VSVLFISNEELKKQLLFDGNKAAVDNIVLVAASLPKTVGNAAPEYESSAESQVDPQGHLGVFGRSRKLLRNGWRKFRYHYLKPSHHFWQYIRKISPLDVRQSLRYDNKFLQATRPPITGNGSSLMALIGMLETDFSQNFDKIAVGFLHKYSVLASTSPERLLRENLAELYTGVWSSLLLESNDINFARFRAVFESQRQPVAEGADTHNILSCVAYRVRCRIFYRILEPLFQLFVRALSEMILEDCDSAFTQLNFVKPEQAKMLGPPDMFVEAVGSKSAESFSSHFRKLCDG
jgi:hypothetical protein